MGSGTPRILPRAASGPPLAGEFDGKIASGRRGVNADARDAESRIPPAQSRPGAISESLIFFDFRFVPIDLSSEASETL
jgi:hypothetical protein